MNNFSGRLISALPDALMATVFLAAWLAPLWFSPEKNASLMLTMPIEFFVIHSGYWYNAYTEDSSNPALSPFMRGALLIVPAAGYLLLILFIAYEAQDLWVFAGFAWLMLARFLHLVLASAPQRKAQGTRMKRMSNVSLLIYLGGIFLVTASRPPAFGWNDGVAAALNLESYPHPQHFILAFGVLYFGAQAVVKYLMSGPGATPSNT